MFTALNNHFFEQNYDYFRYGGKVPIKADSYNKKRQDERHRYDRLAKKFHTKEELENFIVANLITSKKRLWVGLLFGGGADETYVEWKGRVQSLTYRTISELKLLLQDGTPLRQLFVCNEHQHPEILKALMRKTLSLETFVILDMCINFIPGIDSKLKDDRSWLPERRKAQAYKPFLQRLNIDVKALRKAIRTVVETCGGTGNACKESDSQN